jgi:hypothetical protein
MRAALLPDSTHTTVYGSVMVNRDFYVLYTPASGTATGLYRRPGAIRDPVTHVARLGAGRAAGSRAFCTGQFGAILPPCA